MILLLTYGFKVTLLLLIAGVFYRLLLERAPLGDFKRIYLVLMLILAHLIPLLPVRELPGPPVPVEATAVARSVPAPPPVPTIGSEPSPVILSRSSSGESGVGGYLLGLVYATGFFFAARRFVRSVWQVVRQVRSGDRQRYGRAWLIELPGTVPPHTFGRWIFCGAQNRPPAAILAHEYAHAAEWHTLDRLLVAILRTVCWFNPLLYAYERAIVLNHEYLADRAVLRRGFPLRDYQFGLLAALGHRPISAPIASGADFHFTKKRLQMMLLPSASPARATLLWSLTFALGLLLLWGFGRTTVVSPAAAKGQDQPTSAQPTTATTLATAPFAIRERPSRPPTADQLAVWVKTDAYEIWIDGNRVPNAELRNYVPADFPYHTVSRLPNDTHTPDAWDYAVKLTTQATFQRNRFMPSWQRSSCQWDATPNREDC